MFRVLTRATLQERSEEPSWSVRCSSGKIGSNHWSHPSVLGPSWNECWHYLSCICRSHTGFISYSWIADLPQNLPKLDPLKISAYMVSGSLMVKDPASDARSLGLSQPLNNLFFSQSLSYLLVCSKSGWDWMWPNLACKLCGYYPIMMAYCVVWFCTHFMWHLPNNFIFLLCRACNSCTSPAHFSNFVVKFTWSNQSV